MTIVELETFELRVRAVLTTKGAASVPRDQRGRVKHLDELYGFLDQAVTKEQQIRGGELVPQAKPEKHAAVVEDWLRRLRVLQRMLAKELTRWQEAA